VKLLEALGSFSGARERIPWRSLSWKEGVSLITLLLKKGPSPSPQEQIFTSREGN